MPAARDPVRPLRDDGSCPVRRRGATQPAAPRQCGEAETEQGRCPLSPGTRTALARRSSRQTHVRTRLHRHEAVGVLWPSQLPRGAEGRAAVEGFASSRGDWEQHGHNSSKDQSPPQSPTHRDILPVKGRSSRPTPAVMPACGLGQVADVGISGRRWHPDRRYGEELPVGRVQGQEVAGESPHLTVAAHDGNHDR
jgi:hypothetical protein